MSCQGIFNIPHVRVAFIFLGTRHLICNRSDMIEYLSFWRFTLKRGVGKTLISQSRFYNLRSWRATTSFTQIMKLIAKLSYISLAWPCRKTLYAIFISAKWLVGYHTWYETTIGGWHAAVSARSVPNQLFFQTLTRATEFMNRGQTTHFKILFQPRKLPCSNNTLRD